MTTLAALLFLTVILGYPLHRALLRAKRAETLATHRATLLDLRTAALDDARGTVAAQETTIAELEALVRRWRGERDWQRLMQTIAEAEADRHAETHACLPSLAGIRAASAWVESEPMAEWERELLAEWDREHEARRAEVVPIRGERR